jgi:hypothetical protein
MGLSAILVHFERRKNWLRFANYYCTLYSLAASTTGSRVVPLRSRPRRRTEARARVLLSVCSIDGTSAVQWCHCFRPSIPTARGQLRGSWSGVWQTCIYAALCRLVTVIRPAARAGEPQFCPPQWCRYSPAGRQLECADLRAHLLSILVPRAVRIREQPDGPIDIQVRA